MFKELLESFCFVTGCLTSFKLIPCQYEYGKNVRNSNFKITEKEVTRKRLSGGASVSNKILVVGFLYWFVVRRCCADFTLQDCDILFQ